jgi:hypothetical protein
MKFSFTGSSVQYLIDETVVVDGADSAVRSTFPVFQQLSMFGRSALLSSRKFLPESAVMTTDGLSVMVKPRMSQNTRSVINWRDTSRSMKYFMSGDPNVPTHWLTSIGISLNDESFVVSKSSSEMVGIELTVYQSCNRRSCMGCVNPRLAAMCYAMQQCTIVNCVGTVVNQLRPLCNMGLTLQSLGNTLISVSLASWLAFAETYSIALKVAVAGDQQAHVTFVDDAFFGFVCAAKDTGGQITAILTSAIGAVIIGNSRSIDLNNPQAGMVDSRSSARNTLVLNGVSAFMYQASLYPLYLLISLKKIVSCVTTDVAKIVSVSGFTVTIGMPDVANAEALLAGQCMTSYQEENAESGSGDTSVVDSAMSTAGDLAAGMTAENRFVRDAITGAYKKAVSFVSKKPDLAAKASAQKKVQSRWARAANSLNKYGSRALLSVWSQVTDAHLAYFSGVVSGMQDMAQAMDEAHCKFPDYNMYKTLKCACGDTEVKIKTSLAADAFDAHWCTGTLKMLDGFGRVSYVLNPYTFQALSFGLMHAPSYLKCMGTQTNGDTCSKFKPFIKGII